MGGKGRRREEDDDSKSERYLTKSGGILWLVRALMWNLRSRCKRVWYDTVKLMKCVYTYSALHGGNLAACLNPLK